MMLALLAMPVAEAGVRCDFPPDIEGPPTKAEEVFATTLGVPAAVPIPIGRP